MSERGLRDIGGKGERQTIGGMEVNTAAAATDVTNEASDESERCYAER